MKKIISLICIFTLVSMQSAVFASVKVPANTSIFVTPNESVTSKDMTVDTINASIVEQIFRFNHNYDKVYEEITRFI